MNSKTLLMGILMMVIGFGTATGFWITSLPAKDLRLINAQQALIESQQTVIDINEGFVKRLVLQNNEHAEEAAEYRAKWLEALE